MCESCLKHETERRRGGRSSNLESFSQSRDFGIAGGLSRDWDLLDFL